MENYRLSSYCIFTRLRNADNQYILIHGYTGALDIAGGELINFLKSNKDNIDRELFPLSNESFNTLLKRGYITTLTKAEEVAHFKKLATILHKKNNILYKDFIFVVSYDCNFRCPYCYENGVSGDGRHWTKKAFTKELVDKAFDAISQIEPREQLITKQIVLYGGEPLLRENKEVVEYIVSKGKERGITFMAITNGYDLDCFQELLSPDQIAKLQITIDGLKEIHDTRRIHYLTGKSFDKIVQNIKIALDRGVKIAVRYNTDKTNIDDLDKLWALFNSMGYFNNKDLTIRSALLKDYTPIDQRNESNNNTSFDFMTRKEFNDTHKDKKYKFGCQDQSLYQKIFNSINNRTRIIFSSIFCSAQSGEYIFDPYGEIYPCWSMVGNRKYVIGNYSGERISLMNGPNIRSRDVGNSERCSKCQYGLLCGGGCLYHAIIEKGDINQNYCDNFASTFEHTVNRVYDDYVKTNNLYY